MQNKLHLHELPGHTMYERLHKLSYVYSTHVLFGYKICIMCTVFGPSHTRKKIFYFGLYSSNRMGFHALLCMTLSGSNKSNFAWAILPLSLWREVNARLECLLGYNLGILGINALLLHDFLLSYALMKSRPG